MVSTKQIAASAAAVLGLTQLCPAPIIPIIVVSVELGSVASWIAAVGTVAGGSAATAEAIENRNKKRDVDPTAYLLERRDASPFNSRIKRQEENQLAWTECESDLGSATVNFTAPAAGTILVDGIPATCMTLATVLTGQDDLGDPVPMGTSSLQFSGLNSTQISAITTALQAHD